MIRLAALFLILLLSGGCMVRSKEYWKREKQKVETCRNKWVFKDLDEKRELKVLYFQSKSHYDMMGFSNFAICSSDKGDTIGISDIDSDLSLHKNDTVTVVPHVWTTEIKALVQPLFSVSSRAFDNDLFCSIKNVYYGKITRTTGTEIH